MGDEDPPKLSLIAGTDPAELPPSQDDADFERDHFSWELGFAMRNLVANSLRIICEGGRSWELVDQIIAIRETLVNAPPGVTVNDANEVLASALGDVIEDSDSDVGYAIELIQKGALRKIAARLLRQQVQASRRNADLWDGIQTLERVRDANRRRWQEEVAAQQPAPALRRLKVTAKRKPAPSTQSAPKPKEPEEEPRSTAEFMKKRLKEIRGED